MCLNLTKHAAKMKQDMRNLVNNGNGEMADELQKKCAPYINDNLTDGSTTFTSSPPPWP